MKEAGNKKNKSTQGMQDTVQMVQGLTSKGFWISYFSVFHPQITKHNPKPYSIHSIVNSI